MMRDEARNTLTSKLKALGVSVPLTVAIGGITEMVVEHAGQAAADLVVIGRGALPAPFGRLRTHAYGIIQRSPCPVVSV